MQNTQVYSIGVLYQDLQEKQTLKEALLNLSQLSDTVGQVFSKISNRVKEVKSSLEDVDSRLGKCARQVEAVQKMQKGKATTVFSSAKFPGKSPTFVKTLFNDVEYAQQPPPLDDDDDDDVHFLPPNHSRTLARERYSSMRVCCV